MPFAWMLSLAANRAYSRRVVGAGSEEFRRVFHSFLYLAAGVAIVSYSLRFDLARGFVLAALPLALALDLVGPLQRRQMAPPAPRPKAGR